MSAYTIFLNVNFSYTPYRNRKNEELLLYIGTLKNMFAVIEDSVLQMYIWVYIM
jgi:hypothetical protein